MSRDFAIEHIARWGTADPVGWLASARNLWDTVHGGWRFENGQHEIWTGGWAENEAVVSAMRQNRTLWSLCWESSHRGGRHIFREMLTVE